MSKRNTRLEIPEELQHLIEKRDDESDRRGRSRRDASASAGKSDRRQSTDRRRKGRRKSES